MFAKRRFRPSQATVVAPSHRPPLRVLSAVRARSHAAAVATMLVATLTLAGGVAVSIAATTSVYYDSNRNVGAGPNPFNATFTGFDNVALGHTMMPNLTSGTNNVASGSFALLNNTSGTNNVASGVNALLSNTAGTNNVASGTAALQTNTGGSSNIASGGNALFSNTTGFQNVASGVNALFSNTTGHDNVASGVSALRSNTTGTGNIASGTDALRFNSTGSGNVASGFEALFSNTAGNSNVASGYQALYNNTGGNNVALGFAAGINLTSGSNNVAIANGGVAGESGKIRIGTKGKHNAAFLQGVSGASIAGPTQTVVVNAAGRLGTATASSERLKRDVRPLDAAASKGLLALRPVSYRYKRGDKRLQYGLIAEQVARQLPALVQRRPSGRPAGVYYEQLSTLLLAELRRQHHELLRQGRELRRLRAQVRGGR